MRIWAGAVTRESSAEPAGRHASLAGFFLGLFAADLRLRLIIAWALGAGLTAVGLYASWTWDLPTGPAIVTAFGAATALMVLGLSVPKLTMRAAALFASAVVALAGLLLVAFPAMDQPWLDALEDIAPPVQTAFLSSGERFTRIDQNTLRYQVTVEDPQTWPRPWTAEWPFLATSNRLFETACHEGNYSVENTLRGARAEEQRQLQR